MDKYLQADNTDIKELFGDNNEIAQASLSCAQSCDCTSNTRL